LSTFIFQNQTVWLDKTASLTIFFLGPGKRYLDFHHNSWQVGILLAEKFTWMKGRGWLLYKVMNINDYRTSKGSSEN
jgi:hypothetical protein